MHWSHQLLTPTKRMWCYFFQRTISFKSICLSPKVFWTERVAPLNIIVFLEQLYRRIEFCLHHWIISFLFITIKLLWKHSVLYKALFKWRWLDNVNQIKLDQTNLFKFFIRTSKKNNWYKNITTLKKKPHSSFQASSQI